MSITTTDAAGPVTLWVRVPARPDTAQRARAALLVDARGAWTEPGNLKMALHQQVGEPSAFYLYERWKSRVDLEAHFLQPHTQGALALAHGHLESAIEMNDLTPLWPGPGYLHQEPHRALPTAVSQLGAVGEPARVDEALAALSELARRSQGNVEFECHVATAAPSMYLVYERWTTVAAADEFWTRPPVVELERALAPHFASPIRSVRLWMSDIT